jgi:hypothetical protein
MATIQSIICLFERSGYTLVEEMLKTAKANVVYENMSLQIGLGKDWTAKAIPDWFVQDSSTDYSSKFAGTYMASWTFIASPSFVTG